MKRNLLIITLFVFYLLPNLFSQITENKDRKMAIYMVGSVLDDDFQADLFSVEQMVSVTGLPTTISYDFMECLDYGVLLFSAPIHDGTLDESQKDLLINYVENGGCVIFSALTDPDLYELAGITYSSEKDKRSYFIFKSGSQDKELRWIDEPMEREIRLGSAPFGGIYTTYGYGVDDGEVLGLFKEERAGLVKSRRGDGLVYTFGFAWRDLIIRNLLDRDYSANRGYTNHFEATSDVIMLLVRGIFTEAIPYSVWVSPAPYDSKAVLLLTHNISSHTAHIFSNDFAQLEYERGISGTFVIATHKFVDDIYGDNYTSHLPQMKLLLHKGHVIGDHNYGHFPDFSVEEVFLVGEKYTSVNDYNPHYSIEHGRTIGGTVYGEIGVSQMVLEDDFNITVNMHRSGNLAVHPQQYNVLEDLGFLYSSSYSSADVLTGFPFYTHYDRSMNGRQLPIIEIPVALSDVFGSDNDPIDEFNWFDKGELWTSITESYANNNSLTCLLVHPNRSYKVAALEYLLDHMSQDIYPMELTKYADFWKEKNKARFSSSLTGNVLKIYANDAILNNDQISFVIDYPNNIESIEIYNENEELQNFQQKDYYLGTGLMFQKSFSDLKSQSGNLAPVGDLLFQNYPNPFSYVTTIEYYIPEAAQVNLQIMDIYGRVIKEIVNEKKEAGIYKLDLSASHFSSGIYFYRIYIQSESRYYTATQKMIIK